MTMKLVFRQFSLPAMALWAMAMAMIAPALLVLLKMVIVVALGTGTIICHACAQQIGR